MYVKNIHLSRYHQASMYINIIPSLILGDDACGRGDDASGRGADACGRGADASGRGADASGRVVNCIENN